MTAHIREWIYVIHFETPYHHAQHYIGITTDLEARMKRHAAGHGCKLLNALNDQGITWELAGIYEVRLLTDKSGRQLERLMKEQKHGRRYCPVCNPETYKGFPGTTSIDVKTLTFPTCSEEMNS